MAIDAKMSILSKAEKKLSTEITAYDMNRVMSIMADIMQEYEVKERGCFADIDDDLVNCYFDAMAVRGFSEKTMRVYRMYINDMLEYLKVPIRQMGEGKLMEGSGDRAMARTWVINEALKVLGIQEPEPEKEPEAEEQLDVAPLMRLIAGKSGELLKAIEMVHNDLTRIDDHICQVLRRSDW